MNQNQSKQKRNKTPHDVARAYAEKGWSGYRSREDWLNSIRFKGTFTLAKNKHTQ